MVTETGIKWNFLDDGNREKYNFVILCIVIEKAQRCSSLTRKEGELGHEIIASGKFRSPCPSHPPVLKEGLLLFSTTCCITVSSLNAISESPVQYQISVPCLASWKNILSLKFSARMIYVVQQNMIETAA